MAIKNDDVAVITFHCGRGHTIRVPREFAGHKGKCSKCGEPVRIPDIAHPAKWMRFAAWFIKALGILKGVESSGDELARKTDRIKALTLDQAKSLVEHEGDLYLGGLTAISSDVAKALAWHEGDLYLDGLTAISSDVAKALASHEGDLYLDGLTVLEPEAAKSLAFRKGSLSLNGLATISDDVAKALTQYERRLELDVLDILPLETAQELEQDEFFTLLPELHLNGLLALSDESAKALAKHKGLRLHLDGLTMLSDSAAKAFSRHRSELQLNGLTTLSDEAVKWMSLHRGSLYLNGLTTLSDEAAITLRSNHEIFLSDKFERRRNTDHDRKATTR